MQVSSDPSHSQNGHGPNDGADPGDGIQRTVAAAANTAQQLEIRNLWSDTRLFRA